MKFLTQEFFMKDNNLSIAVIGLGYVGLPLAIRLARFFTVVGYDCNRARIAELHEGIDRTNEVEEEALRSTSLHFSETPEEIAAKDLYIVTVPTPVDSQGKPDLGPLKMASTTVGKFLKKGSIVVYESTVYPGVTEDFCAPILEECSGLVSGKDFYLGYSPERINPGDKHHTLDTMIKVVAGQTEKVGALLAEVYGKINQGKIFVAKNIKTAEAAKVIENTQRDINIAFINEITQIFSKLDISIYDVLDAARTKWNFIHFTPGLVGGHCIGVDPYYLAHLAKQVNCEPKIILAGREINEQMSVFIAEQITELLNKKIEVTKPRVLVLGLTFKENVPDLRNTKIVDLVNQLLKKNYTVDVHDPEADKEEAKSFYDIELLTTLDLSDKYDAVVGAVPHQGYRGLNAVALKALLNPNGILIDLKNIWPELNYSAEIHYRSL